MFKCFSPIPGSPEFSLSLSVYGEERKQPGNSTRDEAGRNGRRTLGRNSSFAYRRRGSSSAGKGNFKNSHKQNVEIRHLHIADAAQALPARVI